MLLLVRSNELGHKSSDKHDERVRSYVSAQQRYHASFIFLRACRAIRLLAVS